MAMRVASRRRVHSPSIPEAANKPYKVWEWYFGFQESVPDIMEFVISDRYLNRPNIYPRQATVLKIIFLQDDLFTQYDHDVIGEWIEAYQQSADDNGEGNNGVQPDIYDRIRICKEEGRPWFRETLAVAGRRGSKGHIGGLSGAYVVWNYLAKGDPQGHYGVDRDKRLAALVFAGKKEQAKANQWKDLTNVILGGPCFSPYISNSLGQSLTIYAPHDFARMLDRHERGVESEDDMATFEILPKESTQMAGRGPASFAQFYDEMAHVVASGANRSAEEVYEAATPSLDQFGVDAFIYEPSSPWQKLGQFYANYQQSLEKDEETGGPAYPEMFMFQLASWDIYKDWEKANDLRMWPGGIRFQPLRGAIQAFDVQMQRLERANPETFAVERRSHFAASLNAYLSEARVADIWKPWPDELHPLAMQSGGLVSRLYRAHGDPSQSGANFGFAIAHIEMPDPQVDDRGLPHVVFDHISAWIPGDFEGHEIDYEVVETDVKGYMDAFMPDILSFDQWNSVGTIQSLRRYAAERRYPKRVQVDERTATGPLNWKTYETFKTAVGLGLVHAPFFELADLELRFLQDLGGKVDHPTSGPVQTKDVADCMAIVVYELIGDQMAAFIGKAFGDVALSASVPSASQPFGSPHGGNEQAHQDLSGFSRARGMRPGAASGRRRR